MSRNFGLIVIGDEILSGKRVDKHMPKVIELLGAAPSRPHSTPMPRSGRRCARSTSARSAALACSASASKLITR